MSRLQGKVAVVTGSSRGIGRAIAERLARDGAAVVVNYARSADKANQVVAAIQQKGGRAVAVEADVSTASGVRKLFEQAKKQLGKIDILVNNAAIFETRSIAEVDEAQYDRLFGINVRGPLLAMAEATRYLGSGGRIINISSNAARISFPGASVYAATKAALEALIRCISAELGPRGITVNGVAPGTTDTEMLQGGLSPELREMAIKQTPLGRLGRPDDIADVVAFLASDEARWITGTTIEATGGLRF
jgi:3-oxoacyl-[acyl-carrier protein] reductase